MISGVVTQNVDGLDAASGTRDVIELHGVLGRVVCLGCGARTARAPLEARLAEANSGWVERAAVLVSRAETNADGDAELARHETAGFVVVACEDCGGVLKPDVVFFGEAVDPALVAASYALVERSRALLVLGSSLTVMSGRRFVLRASKLGLPVAIVNRGASQGDRFATVRLDGPLEPVLTGAVQALQARRDGSAAGTGIRGRAQAIL